MKFIIQNCIGRLAIFLTLQSIASMSKHSHNNLHIIAICLGLALPSWRKIHFNANIQL